MILDLTNKNKIQAIYDFIHRERNVLGGMITSLIIPPNFIPYMYEMFMSPSSNGSFYHLGYYHEFRFPVFVDRDLISSMYLICNNGAIKVEVIDGPGLDTNVGGTTSTGSHEVENGNSHPS